MAIAILGAYTGGIILYKIKSAISGGGKKAVAPEPTKPVEAAPTTTGVPGIETPAFEKFVETEAFAKLLENEEQLKTLVESA